MRQICTHEPCRRVGWAVIGNSIDDRADTKRHNIEQTFKTTINDMTGLLTNRQTLQKKLEHRHRSKNNLNFYGNHTNGTFAFAASHEANPKAKAKEPLFANALSFFNEY